MSGLIHYNINSYTSWSGLFDALRAIPNFWDESSPVQVKKGGITLTCDGNNHAISGYGNSVTLQASFYVSRAPIAATEKGLVFGWEAGSKLYSVALNCDIDGNWCGAYSAESTNGISINNFVADNITATNFAGGLIYESNPNTQIVDLACNKGNFICEDLRRVLYAPTHVINYNGKLTMPNGEKYVKNGPFVLRYTE